MLDRPTVLLQRDNNELSLGALFLRRFGSRQASANGMTGRGVGWMEGDGDGKRDQTFEKQDRTCATQASPRSTGLARLALVCVVCRLPTQARLGGRSVLKLGSKEDDWR